MSKSLGKIISLAFQKTKKAHHNHPDFKAPTQGSCISKAKEAMENYSVPSLEFRYCLQFPGCLPSLFGVPQRSPEDMTAWTILSAWNPSLHTLLWQAGAHAWLWGNRPAPSVLSPFARATFRLPAEPPGLGTFPKTLLSKPTEPQEHQPPAAPSFTPVHSITVKNPVRDHMNPGPTRPDGRWDGSEHLSSVPSPKTTLPWSFLIFNWLHCLPPPAPTILQWKSISLSGLR